MSIVNWLFKTDYLVAIKQFDRLQMQDWCFQEKISNETFDCVLMLLQHDGSTNAKLKEKNEGRCYYGYCKIITTEYK